MPPGETLENFAATGATLAIHLGVRALREIERRLAPLYGADCPVAVVYRVGWPDQQVIPRHAVGHPRARCARREITRTALVLVGPALGETHAFPDSALYDGRRPHLLRPRARD